MQMIRQVLYSVDGIKRRMSVHERFQILSSQLIDNKILNELTFATLLRKVAEVNYRIERRE